MDIFRSIKNFFPFKSPGKRRRIEGDVEIEVESLPAPKRPALVPKSQDLFTAAPEVSLKTAQAGAGRDAPLEAPGMGYTPLTEQPKPYSWKQFNPPSTKKRTARPSFMGLSARAEKETAEVVKPPQTLPAKQLSKKPQGQFVLSFRKHHIGSSLETPGAAAGGVAEIQPESLRAPFMQPSVDTDRFPMQPVDNSHMDYTRSGLQLVLNKLGIDGVASSEAKMAEDAELTRRRWKQSSDLGIQKAKTSYKPDDGNYLQLQEQLEEMQNKVVNLRLEREKVEGEEVEGKSIPLPTLSQEDYDIYEETIRRPLAEQLVVHKTSGINLHGKDMKRLGPREWLNDEVINLYMSLLLERDTLNRKDRKLPKCHFFNSFFCNSLYKDANTYDYTKVRRWTLPVRLKSAGQASQSVLELDRIIMPVNQGNMHWVCAVIDLKKKQFIYYDSLSGEDEKCLENLARYLTDEYKNKRNEDREDIMEWPRLFPKNIPQQDNGCDCGMFAILFADYAGQDGRLDFSQDNIQDFRVKVTRDLLRTQVE